MLVAAVSEITINFSHRLTLGRSSQRDAINMSTTANTDDSAGTPDGMPPALSPLGPQVAGDDPHGQADDFDSFKRKANATYPGIDISKLDPDEVRRWIDAMRRKTKRKGNG